MLEKKAVSGIILTLMLIGMLTFTSSIQIVKAGMITVPEDYRTIQQAINNANEGDTVCVKAGTYYENVVVNKTVLLIGENKESTIIDGNNTYREVIKIMANNTIVSGFTVKNSSQFGIQIRNSFGNTIKDNNVFDTFYGIRLDQSASNSIIGNTAKSNRFMGILLGSSSNNILRYNEMANNPQNFGVWGISISDFINDVDTSNTVNGKPVYYWINQHNRQIPADAGVVMVVNSSKIIVKNLTLGNNDHGVYFAYTSSSFIERNVVTNNTYGIDLFQSFNNTISGNVVLLNTMGISMRFASNNNIVRNNSVIASSNGVYLYQSNANRIIGNTIRNSQDYGIDFHESNGNSFYHNNLISNKRNVCPYATGTNIWDDGYPSGGNYWSDYTGTDLYNGPFQNVTGSDGIGDTPYVIGANNIDHFPLMKPVTGLVSRAIRIIDARTGLDSITLGSPTKPMPSDGYPFTINVTLDGTTNYLHSFQVAIAFDKTEVKCTAAWIPKDDQNFVFYGESPIMRFVGVYNDLGLVALGSSLSEDYVVPDHSLPRYLNVSGEKLLCQINFTAIETGTSALEIITTKEPLYPWNTTLLDKNNNPIDFTAKGFSVTAIALQPPLVTAYIRIQPQALNLKSRGKWIIAYIELPEGYNVADIGIPSILLNDTILAELRPIAIGDYDNDSIPDLMVKFDRAEVVQHILKSVDMSELLRERFMTVALTMTGKLNDGTPFQGNGTITIILPVPRGYRAFRI